ncbi:hypothetical protein B7463_g8033, partial [Scytalidium lignicola]
MATLQKTAFASPLFEFRIGPKKKSFMINSTTLSRISKPLDTMMNGDMIESRSNSADLEHVDEEIWELICQYAYIGDYDVKTFRDLTRHPNQEILFNPKTAETKRKNMWQRFKDATYTYLIPENPALQTVRVEKTVLRYHAEVYVFADQYGMLPLQNLALQKLKRILEGLVIFPSLRTEICELVRFCYENTPSRPRDDKLRAHIAHYVACIFESLAPSKDFQEVTEEFGSFSRDLLMELQKRLK